MKEIVYDQLQTVRVINRDIVIPQKEFNYYNELIGKIDYLSPNDQLRVANTAKVMMWIFDSEKMKERDDGSPASSHLLETALILAEYKLPAIALQYGLLHDVPEDTKDKYGLNFITKVFGEEVADGVARIGIVKEIKETEEEQEKSDKLRDQNLRARLYEAVIENPLAAITRFAERLHNLRTIEARFKRSPESARRTARESITVYAPLLWDLGEYNMSWEMYARSLAVLFPDQMEIIEGKNPKEFVFDIKDERFQAIKPDRQEKVSKVVADTINADPNLISVYPPNLKILANLMLESEDISKIEPESCPMDIDVLSNDEETALYVWRLLHNERFGLAGKAADRFMHDLQRNQNRPLYLRLQIFDESDNLPLPVSFNFLTAEHKKNKLASIMDKFSLQGTNDPDILFAAESKWNNVKELLERVRHDFGPDTGIDTVFQAAIEKKIIFPHLIIDGHEFGNIAVASGSSVLQIALLRQVREFMAINDLPEDYFLRIQDVTIGKDKRLYSIGAEITSSETIHIKTSEEITIRPGWFRKVTQIDKKPMEMITDSLTELIKSDPKLKEEARLIGKDIIDKDFRQKSHFRRNISVIRGFDGQFNKYVSGPPRFYTDIGIGLISQNKAREVVNRMVEWFNSLPQIHIYVPSGHNTSGYESICSSVLGKEKINIITFEGGEYDFEKEGRQMSAEITYYLDNTPENPITLRRIASVRRKIKMGIRNIRGHKAAPYIDFFMSENERLRKNSKS